MLNNLISSKLYFLNFKSRVIMKVKIAITILGAIVTTMTFAQSLQKQYYENTLNLGGDVVVKSSQIALSKNDEVCKTFEIESPTAGTFYLDAWLSAPQTPKGYPEYKVSVNNVVLEASLKPKMSNWGSVSLTDYNKSASTVKLKKGLNSITIWGAKQEVPNVEHIKLSSSAINSGISDSKYKAYIKSIEDNALNLSTDIEKLPKDSIVAYDFLPEARAAGQTYTYQMNMVVPYTTTYLFYYREGAAVNINVTQKNNYEYVLEVFDMNSFTNSRLSYAWTRFSRGNTSLQFTVPKTAFYTVRLRAYRQMSSGLADLKVDDKVYTNCAISGNGLAYHGSSTQTEVFTCQSPYQMYLYLEGSGLPGKIEEYKILNTTYPNGKYGCQLSLPNLTGISAGLFSHSTSSNPTFYADIYLGLTKVPQSTLNYFPNLKSAESYCSGSQTGVYNCISWTVGVTSDWIWPGSLSNFDALYNSYGYTRTGANASNAAIALWGTSSSSLTHASVRKNSTIPNPHGFDWESKCGGLERVMHFRDALSGSSYGNILYYYRPISGTVSSLATSPDFTTSTFSSTELAQIDALRGEVPQEIVSEFNTKYAAWKKTWSNPEIALSSNPRNYAESNEYSKLTQFCQKYGKVTWPLFIDKLAEGDVFVSNLLEDLTSPKKDNKKIYDEAITLKSRSIGIPSPFIYSNMVEYSKRLLAQENMNIRSSIKSIDKIYTKYPQVNITTENSNIVLTVNSLIATSITINVYDIYGTSVHNANYNIPANGWKSNITTTNFKKGIYVVQVVINGQTISDKVNINI